MNSLWIQKPLECDENTIQLTCPFCHNDKFFTHKDSEKMLKYCPTCGKRMEFTDAELIDVLQKVVEGRGKIIECLEKELDAKNEELLAKHNAYAELRHEYSLLNAVYEDMKKVMVKIRPSEWAAIAKKHNKEN